jgi:hypothetical protein
MKLIRMMLKPVRIYCIRPSAFVLIADVKKRKRAPQHASFVLNMKAYMPINTDPSWYNSAMPPSPSPF